MKESRPPSKVTLEDLLRFKRAEKPDASFWVHFEQEFRAKQLAAAVERKRWWFALPRFMPRRLISLAERSPASFLNIRARYTVIARSVSPKAELGSAC